MPPGSSSMMRAVAGSPDRSVTSSCQSVVGFGPVPRPGVVESDPVAGRVLDGPRRSGSAGVQHDVEVYPVAVVVSHGVVASLRTGFWVDITCPVGAGEDRWGDAFAVGGWDGEVDADCGVAGLLYGEGLGIVDLQRDPAQAWTQLPYLDDGREREAHRA